MNKKLLNLMKMNPHLKSAIESILKHAPPLLPPSEWINPDGSVTPMKFLPFNGAAWDKTPGGISVPFPVIGAKFKHADSVTFAELYEQHVQLKPEVIAASKKKTTAAMKMLAANLAKEHFARLAAKMAAGGEVGTFVAKGTAKVLYENVGDASVAFGHKHLPANCRCALVPRNRYIPDEIEEISARHIAALLKMRRW